MKKLAMGLLLAGLVSCGPPDPSSYTKPTEFEIISVEKTIVQGTAAEVAFLFSYTEGRKSNILISEAPAGITLSGEAIYNPATSSTYTVKATVPNSTPVGTYSFQITANDGIFTKSATGTIKVISPAMSPTVSLTASATSITSPSSVTLTATPSNLPTGAQVRILGNGTILRNLTSPPFTYSRSFTSADNGSYTYTAAVWDGGQQVAESQPVTITVNISNTPTPPVTPPPNSPAFPHGYKPPCISPYLIKGNLSSTGERIYHVPGGAYYNNTIAEVCYITEADAQADGFRRSSR